MDDRILNNVPKTNVASASNRVLTDIKPEKQGSKGKCAVVGVLCGSLLCAFTLAMYNNWIRYPKQQVVDTSQTGIYALENYVSVIHSQKPASEKDYLGTEVEYANSNESRLNFINKVINTVSYTPKTIVAKNIYGNDMIDRKTKQIVKIPSYVTDTGEKVTFSYVDYSSIVFDVDTVRSMVLKANLKSDDVDYGNKLVDLFCDYISSLGTLPIISEERAPFMSKTVSLDDKGNSVTNYVLSDEEEEYIDNVLFSSIAFSECKNRFTELVGNILTGKELAISDSWSEWNSLDDSKKKKSLEPDKYGEMSMASNWCGAYYIDTVVNNLISKNNSSEYSSKITPNIGDGTKDNPAGIGTPVITSMFNNEDGKVVERPIKVELVKFGVSQDAIDYFQSKDIHNRGYNLESEVQYCYCVFKVTNLSDVSLNVKDNFSLCDKYSNLYSSTGSVLGLKSSVLLEPNESGYIETWSNSICLNKQYVIWGKDFDRKTEPVWFRVLQGNKEDSSEDKGVHIVSRGTN